MGRSAKEYCRPHQVVDGGGQVSQGKVDYGEDDDDKPWLNKIIGAAVDFYAKKEIAGEFGEGIGSGLKGAGLGEDEDEGDE